MLLEDGQFAEHLARQLWGLFESDLAIESRRPSVGHCRALEGFASAATTRPDGGHEDAQPRHTRERRACAPDSLAQGSMNRNPKNVGPTTTSPGSSVGQGKSSKATSAHAKMIVVGDVALML